MENIIAICKDCDNGTLNGKTNPQFHIHNGAHNDVVLCNRCDSGHVDVVSVTDGEEDAEQVDADDVPVEDNEGDRFPNRYNIEGD
jgi:hypothetical protein